MSNPPVLPISVLIIDDNAHMRTIIKNLLRSIGVAHISECSDAVEAFVALARSPADVILTDIAMPWMDGVEFTFRLRTDMASPDQFVPVIMVSGHSERHKVAAARDAGATEFLVKPITARGLLDRLRSIVERPRTYVRAAGYFGPDRRRRAPDDYTGPRRRQVDQQAAPAPASA